MKKLFSFFAAILLSTGVFAQGYNVEVCVNLSGPPLTGPITATLNYYSNGMSNTSSMTISNVSLPYTFCFPAYLQMPDSGFFAYATGSVQLSNCGPAQSYSYGQMISGNATISVNAQNCGGPNQCSVGITPILGSTLIEANATGVAPFTYSWDGGMTFSSNNTFNTSGSGTYCVTALDAAGCSSNDCFTFSSNNCSATINATGTFPSSPM
jgi:hypothetical protein